jgi:putative transposase
MLSKRRNKTAATKVFTRANYVIGLPCKIVLDRSGTNTAAISAANRLLVHIGLTVAASGPWH